MKQFYRAFIAATLVIAVFLPSFSIVCSATETPLLETTENSYDTAEINEIVATESEPNQPETVLSEPEAEPSEPETEPSEPETEPSKPETEPSEPETEPSEPETEPSEPETEPSKPETEPSEPETEPSEPETESSEPETEPSEPETEPSESETEPSEPETEPSESETEPSEPETEPTESDEVIPATDLDIEDVESPMVVGKSQMITAVVIPSNSTDTEIIFQSLTPDIASVNALGRVKALKAGTARIQISVGMVSQIISIVIKDVENEDIAAVEIDLSYENTMIVGSTQTLYPSLLPSNSNSEVTYSSNDTAVATVNSFGKVTAVSPGTVYITAYAGDASTKIKITVEAEKGATTIDVSDFKDKMKVEETQTIAATVFPTDAEDQEIKFYSSNRSVATVSNGGFITAVGKGTATISLYCGGASKRLQLTVYVPTEEIRISENFLIMQPNETHNIDAIVLPEDADQELKFKSTNTNIITVSSDGLITAISPGKASIVIENDDSMKSITIIVNEYGQDISDEDNDSQTSETGQNKSNSSTLVEIIKASNSGEIITVQGDECPYITTDVLQALYNTDLSLQIQYDTYIMRIVGSMLRNPHNEFSTIIQQKETKQGRELIIGNDSALPGEIEIVFTNLPKRYKHLYLYNEASEKYEKLNEMNQHAARISISGKYLITKHKLHTFNAPLFFIISGGIITTSGIAIYVVTKKKYLFW